MATYTIIQYFNCGREMITSDGPGNSFDGFMNPYDGNGHLFDGNENPYDGNGYPFDGNGYPFDGNSEVYGINGNPFNGNGNPSLTRPTRHHTPETPWIYCSTCKRDHMGTCWLVILCKTCGKRHRGRCWNQNKTTSEYRQQSLLAEKKAERHSQASVRNHTSEIQWIYCSKCNREHRGMCWHNHEESNDSLSTRTNTTVIHRYNRQSSTYSDFREEEPHRALSRSSDGMYRSRPRTGIIQSQIGPYHERVSCKICGKTHKDRCWHEKEQTTSGYRQRSPHAANKSVGKSQASLVDEKNKTDQIDNSTDIMVSDIKKKDCSASVVDEKNKSDQIDNSTKLINVKELTEIKKKDCPASLVYEKKEIGQNGQIGSSTKLTNVKNHTVTHITGKIIPDIKQKDYPASLVDEKKKTGVTDSSTKYLNIKKHTDTNLTGIVAPDIKQNDCPASLVDEKKKTGVTDSSTKYLNIKKHTDTNLTGIVAPDIKQNDCPASLVDEKKKTGVTDSSTKYLNIKKHTDTNLTGIVAPDIKQNDCPAALINVKKEIPNTLGEIDNSSAMLNVKNNTKRDSTVMIDLNIVKKDCPDSLVDEKKKTGQTDSSTKYMNNKKHTDTNLTGIIAPDIKQKDCPATIINVKKEIPNSLSVVDNSSTMVNVNKNAKCSSTVMIDLDIVKKECPHLLVNLKKEIPSVLHDIKQNDCPAALINVKKEIPNTLGEIDNSSTMLNVKNNTKRDSTVMIDLNIVKKDCPASLVDEKKKTGQTDSSTKYMNNKKHTDTNLTGIIAPDIKQKDCPATIINVKKEIPNSLSVVDNSSTMVNVNKNAKGNSTVMIDLDIVKKECPHLLVNLKKEIPSVLHDIDDISTTPMNVKNCIGTNLTDIIVVQKEPYPDSLEDVKKKAAGVNNSTKVLKVKKDTELFPTNKIDASLINVNNETPNLLGEIDNSTTKTYSTDDIIYNSTQTRKINQNCSTDSQSIKRMSDNNGEFVPKKYKIKHGPNEPACDVYDQPTKLLKTCDKTIKSVEDQTGTKRAGLLFEAGTKVPNKLGQINNQTPLTNDAEIRKKFYLSDIVVKYLQPYYHNNYIRNTKLFKFMAKNICHTLLKSPIFPEEQFVQNIIENMFEMYEEEIINCENDARRALQHI